MFGNKKEKKPVNTEVDLVAFISLLSVCICFLLLTTIWIQIGSMNVKQAVGGQAASGKPKPEMWVLMSPKGDLKLELRNMPRKVVRQFSRKPIEAVDGKPNIADLTAYLEELTGGYKDLTMALIRPAEKTPFEDIIQVMDSFRDKGIADLGVTPL